MPYLPHRHTRGKVLLFRLQYHKVAIKQYCFCISYQCVRFTPIKQNDRKKNHQGFSDFTLRKTLYFVRVME